MGDGRREGGEEHRGMVRGVVQEKMIYISYRGKKYNAWIAKSPPKTKTKLPVETKPQILTEVYEELSQANLFGKLICISIFLKKTIGNIWSCEDVDLNVKPGVHKVNIPIKFLQGISESKKKASDVF